MKRRIVISSGIPDFAVKKLEELLNSDTEPSEEQLHSLIEDHPTLLPLAPVAEIISRPTLHSPNGTRVEPDILARREGSRHFDLIELKRPDIKMTLPALKGEVSINKMLKLTNPRLRRFNVVVNSFDGCISNTPKEFSRTPKVSFWEISSEPRMFFHEHPRRKSLKQLKSLTNTHSRGKLNKQVDVVGSDVQLINLESSSISNLSNKKLTIHSEPVKLEGIHCIFNFPDKMESILSKAVFSGFQIHFSSPETLIRNKVLTKFVFSFKEGSIYPTLINDSTELNLLEDGDSSPNLKVRVSSPLM